MSDDKNAMVQKLRETVIPRLRSLGFKETLPHFRRLNAETIDLITFQTDRYGGGFVIELAKTNNETLVKPWGKEILPNKLTAHDLNKRIRIHPVGQLKDSSTEDWFRYDRDIPGKQDRYSHVADQVANQIENIERLFKLNIGEWNSLAR